ncbi:histidine kinase dimerization/phosphoacceptor domain -containing protein [Halalkalibaculum sp. DA384]|uniref:sensor histidine kinase n=1 Tax=Halalkalibaculum sp. DA384 TaxID=3373606 RepID=UPI003754B365
MKTRNYHSSCRNIGFAILTVLFVGIWCTGSASAQSALGDQFTPLHQVKADRDGDGTPDMLGDTVTVSGLASIETGLLHEVYLQIFIQDDSTGLSLFARSFDQPIARGDSLVVTGVVQQYFGMTEVKVLEYEVFEPQSPLPGPVPMSRALRNLETYEGMLVGGTATVTGKGSQYNGKYLVVTPSDSVARSVQLYVSNFHSLYSQFDTESLASGDRVRVAGIVSLYNPGKVEGEGYNIFLRDPGDLETVGLTQYTLFTLGIIGLVVTVLGVGWIVSLRSRVKSKTREIQQSLEEKELLLKEIHHRVKNNLAIISGLIELQMDSSKNEETQQVLRDSQSRIQSMALVHDKLYRTSTVTDIGMQTYIEELVESLRSMFVGPNSDVELRFDIDEVHLDIDRAIPCGLLVNELVVNSFKHAFTGEQGVLEVKLKKGEDVYRLSIADNGDGLPADFREKMESSLGLMLVETFKSQLRARMQIENRNGAHFLFEIPINGQA